MIAGRYKRNTPRSPSMEKTVKEIKCVCQVVLYNFTKEFGTTSGKVLVLSTSAYLQISLLYLRKVGPLGTKCLERISCHKSTLLKYWTKPWNATSSRAVYCSWPCTLTSEMEGKQKVSYYINCVAFRLFMKSSKVLLTDVALCSHIIHSLLVCTIFHKVSYLTQTHDENMSYFINQYVLNDLKKFLLIIFDTVWLYL